MDTAIDKKLNFILKAWETRKNINKDFHDRVNVNKNEIIEELINIEHKRIMDKNKQFENISQNDRILTTEGKYKY